MTRAAEFKAVYRFADVYEDLLPPHYYDGVEDADLVGRLMEEHYGRPGQGHRLRILELGCGTGRVTSWLAPYSARLVAVDSSPSMVETFRTRFPDAETHCVDTRTAVRRMLEEDLAGKFDVVGAFWSLSYPLGDFFEKMTAEGIRPTADITGAREHAGRLVRDLLRLLAPNGHLLVLFFDSETREQHLVTRLWERVAPFPESGRGYTRQILLDELRAAENRGDGWLTHTRRSGVAVTDTRNIARAWINLVHLKGFPALLDDSGAQHEIDEFVASCIQPSGEVILPTGVHIIDFLATSSAAHHIPAAPLPTPAP